jgi:hypothetical protein
MNGIRTNYIEPRGASVNLKEWESILGKLDVLADEINKALGRSTRIEEPRRHIRIDRLPKDD